MDFQGIHDRLKAIQAPGLVAADLPREPDPADKKDKGRYGDPFVLVEPARVVEFLTVCKNDPQLRFEQLADLSATDPSKDDENLWLNVQLLSLTHRHRLAVKCIVPKSDARVPSAAQLHRGAQYHERECMEMFGITFVGNPDPRNILLPDDWVGHPLRKDYEFPREYHGISCE